MASVTVPSRQPWLGGIDGSRRGLMGHSIGHHERCTALLSLMPDG
jgi:hypothetical protein